MQNKFAKSLAASSLFRESAQILLASPKSPNGVASAKKNPAARLKASLKSDMLIAAEFTNIPLRIRLFDGVKLLAPAVEVVWISLGVRQKLGKQFDGSSLRHDFQSRLCLGRPDLSSGNSP